MLIKAATGGLLSFIPLRLVINPKKTIIPATGAPTTIYVVTVEFQGGIEELQQKALTMGRERVSLIENMRDIEIEAKKIVSGDIDSDAEREEREFAEEFFPESIEVKTEKKEETDSPFNIKVKIVKKKAAAKKKEKVEPEPEPEPEAIEPSTKITRDQLVVILNLKSKTLKINDQVAWGSLIKKMKFKDVFKANDMTAEQGDEFIEHLKSLADIPF